MNKHTKHKVEDLLDSWGRTERRLPERNETLKRETLEKLPTAPIEAPVPSPFRAFPWPSLALALAGVGVFLFVVGGFGGGHSSLSVAPAPALEQGTAMVQEAQDASRRDASDDVAGSIPAAQGTAVDGSFAMEEGVAPEYYPLPPSVDTREIPVTDTREFLKIDYRAQIRTRHAEELAERLLLTVRGLGGRVDSATYSQEYGFIQFVVPKDEFETFRSQIENMVRARFLIQDVSTENLLPQKQSIEEERESLAGTLEALSAERARVVSAHTQAVAALQLRLQTVAEELKDLEAERGGTSKEKERREARKEELVEERSALYAILADENTTYAARIGALDARIRAANEDVGQNAERDHELQDTVETVRGTITFEWISVWEVIQLYGAAYWLAALFVVLAVVSYLFPRRRYVS